MELGEQSVRCKLHKLRSHRNTQCALEVGTPVPERRRVVQGLGPHKAVPAEAVDKVAADKLGLDHTLAERDKSL